MLIDPVAAPLHIYAAFGLSDSDVHAVRVSQGVSRALKASLKLLFASRSLPHGLTDLDSV